MSLFSFMGALEMGFIFALVALGVLLSFRILDFPDLTADGSFPLGGATAAVLIVAGWNPWLACLAAAAAGAAAGLLTAWLYVRLGIMQLLASILTMIALYSVNLRIMGAPNLSLLGEPSVFSPFLTDDNAMWARPLALGLVVLAVKLGLDGFFASQTGLALRATGANPRMARAQGVPTGRLTLGGMALSNALIALGGALYVQVQGGADVSMGVGTIVIGLAAVIIGETLLPARLIWVVTLATALGALAYRLFIALALEADFIGLQAQDLNLVTATLVAVALVLPKIKARLWPRRAAPASPPVSSPATRAPQAKG